MEPFKVVVGRIAPMLAANTDTDVIMPKQFLKGIDRKGLDRGVFFDQRFLDTGEPNPDFVLNRSPWQNAIFLAVGPNFGCGSSREHAVWGLKQLGIRALIGTTFAGIFHDNCQRNGLLTIELTDNEYNELATLASADSTGDITVDLPAQAIRVPGNSDIRFEINGMQKDALMLGLDAIGMTMKQADAIRNFERRHLEDNPWLA